MAYKEVYNDYKAHGICVRCNKESVAEGHVYCQKCLDDTNNYRREHRHKKVAMGLCGYNDCTEHICDHSKWLCDKHAEIKRIQNLRYYKRVRGLPYE